MNYLVIRQSYPNIKTHKVETEIENEVKHSGGETNEIQHQQILKLVKAMWKLQIMEFWFTNLKMKITYKQVNNWKIIN